MRNNTKKVSVLTVAIVVTMFWVLVACGSDQKEQTAGGVSVTSELTGTIEVDGSSTVYPISEAVAEEFNKLYPKVRVNVGVSGTGGGFK